jgi:hypothetical protein
VRKDTADLTSQLLVFGGHIAKVYKQRPLILSELCQDPSGGLWRPGKTVVYKVMQAKHEDIRLKTPHRQSASPR